MTTFYASYLTGVTRKLTLKAQTLDAAMIEAYECRGYKASDETIVLTARAPWIAGISDGMDFSVARTTDTGAWEMKPAGVAKLLAVAAHTAQVAA